MTIKYCLIFHIPVFAPSVFAPMLQYNTHHNYALLEALNVIITIKAGAAAMQQYIGRTYNII